MDGEETKPWQKLTAQIGRGRCLKRSAKFLTFKNFPLKTPPRVTRITRDLNRVTFSLLYGLLTACLPACWHLPCLSPIFGAEGVMSREKNLARTLSASGLASIITPEQITSHCLDWQSCSIDVVQQVWLTDYGVLTDNGVLLRLSWKSPVAKLLQNQV